MKDSSHGSWLWVAAQIALLALLLLSAPGSRWAVLHPLHPIGMVLTWAGLALVVASALNLGRSLTPLPAPKAAAELKTDGLFRLVRHPIYSGVMLWAIVTAKKSAAQR